MSCEEERLTAPRVVQVRGLQELDDAVGETSYFCAVRVPPTHRLRPSSLTLGLTP